MPIRIGHSTYIETNSIRAIKLGYEKTPSPQRYATIEFQDGERRRYDIDDDFNIDKAQKLLVPADPAWKVALYNNDFDCPVSYETVIAFRPTFDGGFDPVHHDSFWRKDAYSALVDPNSKRFACLGDGCVYDTEYEFVTAMKAKDAAEREQKERQKKQQSELRLIKP